MPNIYLSPSTQEFNPYINGGTEEYYMNLIADEMIPYLRSSGIQYKRNTPEMTAASSIIESNQGNYDLHLALHSNAAPEELVGKLKGTDVYYYPYSQDGRAAANTIAYNLENIYPYPELVKAVETTRIGEVYKTKAPSVLIEFAYHDNEEDANWIKNNIPEIAENVVLSLTEYFEIPFIKPQPLKIGTVKLNSGYLNIRSKPSTYTDIVGVIPNGALVEILGQWEDWYTVDYEGIVGYAKSEYIVENEG